MLLPRLNLRRGVWPLLMLLAVGCGSREQIESYTVRKPELIDPTLANAPAPGEPKPTQTLGAIVVLENAGWFFKTTGDPGTVGPQKDAFLNFVKSIRFSSGADPQPQWDLPEGWTERPGGDFRFATVEMPAGQEKLDLAISVLPKNVPDEEFVLNNVNRWRGQVGLDATNVIEFARSRETFDVDGNNATFVSLVGQSAAGGGMPGAPFAPFAGGASAAPGSSPTEPVRPKTAPAPASGDTLTYEIPAGWIPGRTTEFRKAAFSVKDGDQELEITVIPLGAGSGTLLQNVNRWRGQIKLPEVKEAELAKLVKKVETLGVAGDYVELVGPTDTILGVMAPAEGQVWFIKLSGDSKLAERENARFQEFVKSLRFK